MMLSTAAWPRQPRKEDRSAGDTRDLQLAQGLEEVLRRNGGGVVPRLQRVHPVSPRDQDRKSTRLNSSHTVISYAVFCLKKKKKTLTSIAPTETSNNRA